MSHQPIEPLDLFLEQLPEESQKQVLRVAAQCGLKESDPIFPLLAACQFYVNLYSEIPDKVSRALTQSQHEQLRIFAVQEERLQALNDSIKTLSGKWTEGQISSFQNYKRGIDKINDSSAAEYKTILAAIEKERVLGYSKAVDRAIEVFDRQIQGIAFRYVLAWSVGAALVFAVIFLGAGVYLGLQFNR